MHLYQLQSNFRKALLQSSLSKDLPICQERGRAQEHLWVYQNNLYQSLYKNLSDKFKMTKSFLGEDLFFALGKEYIFNFPQVSPYLCEYGSNFPGTIRDSVARELAGLEWAMNLSLISYKAESLLDFDELLFTHPHLVNGFVLRLHSSIQLYKASYKLKDIWTGLKKGKKNDCYQETSYFFIAVENQKSFFFSLEKDEYDFLKMIQEEKSLGDLYSLFSDESAFEKMLSKFISYCVEVINKPF